jgi:putative toxin-antitoxin system antitoxin component (TIGR02293 family)
MTTVATKRSKARALLTRYRKSFSNGVSVQLKAKKGLRPQAVFDFIALSGFSNQVIEQLLNKSMKTFSNYKEQSTSLDAVVSEKILKLFSLYDKGISVFGSVDEFNRWLGLEAFGLGQQVPLDMMDTITGIDLVNEELVRIEFGDLA